MTGTVPDVKSLRPPTIPNLYELKQPIRPEVSFHPQLTLHPFETLLWASQAPEGMGGKDLDAYHCTGWQTSSSLGGFIRISCSTRDAFKWYINAYLFSPNPKGLKDSIEGCRTINFFLEIVHLQIYCEWFGMFTFFPLNLSWFVEKMMYVHFDKTHSFRSPIFLQV